MSFFSTLSLIPKLIVAYGTSLAGGLLMLNTNRGLVCLYRSNVQVNSAEWLMKAFKPLFLLNQIVHCVVCVYKVFTAELVTSSKTAPNKQANRFHFPSVLTAEALVICACCQAMTWHASLQIGTNWPYCTAFQMPLKPEQSTAEPWPMCCTSQGPKPPFDRMLPLR